MKSPETPGFLYYGAKMNELDKLVTICHANIDRSDKCREYLYKKRRLSLNLINKYKFGYFPQNIGKLTQHVNEELLIKNSIINSLKNSEFADYFYLIIPLINEYNETVGISGRVLLDESEREYLGIPKYKNSSFKKSNFLFGLNFAKKYIIESNNVYIVEGYFDQISMSQNGIPNSVAICGTAFSQYHFYKLAKYCDKMTFVLDSDEAGRKSAQRIYSKFLNKGIKLRFLKVPGKNKDVDEYFSNPTNNKNSFFQDFKQIIPEDW
jgi:DNA primase